MISTYIFDLGDTIVDSSIFSRIYNEIINQLLKSLKISEIELQQIITKLKEETNSQKVDSFELCKKLNSTELYYTILKKYIKHTYNLKNKSVPSIFKKIKSKKKKIGIVSTAQLRTIKMFLERFNLLEYVDFIETGKKDTVLFWITLEKRNHLDKQFTLVIDDNDQILEMAKHAGYKILNVRDLNNLDQFDNF